MKKQICRKFLVKELPDLSRYSKKKWHRFYLFCNSGVEVRIQKVDNKFEWERKVSVSDLSREEMKIEITQKEFEKFKSNSIGEIERDSYDISTNPHIKLLVYHGKFEGFNRVEVDFENEVEAKDFKPLNWFGKEITNTDQGRDSRLLKL